MNFIASYSWLWLELNAEAFDEAHSAPKTL